MSEIDLKDRKFGIIPSQKNPQKDFKINMVMAPVNVFPRKIQVPFEAITNQHDTNMCGGFSGGTIRRTQERNEHKKDIAFSEAFLYADRVPGTDHWGEGVVLKAMWQRALDRGVARKEKMPQIGSFLELYDYLQANWVDLITDASYFKISAFVPVYQKYFDSDPEPLDMIKNGLLQEETGVQLAIPIYESFSRVTYDRPVVPIPKKGEALLGYHAVDTRGTDDDERWMPTQNSWGPGFARNGVFYIPYDYPFLEAFVISNKKQELPPDLKPNDPVPPPQPKLYRVQVGAFKVRENADSLKAKLAADGWPKTFITTVDGWYKVQTGAYSYKENAEKEMARLVAKGYSVFINVY